MAKHVLWSDEYWLLLMQLYLNKPVGAKALYSRKLVDLALELHIQPKFLYEQMFRLRQLETPKIEQLWKTYGKSPKKLSKEVNLLRQMNGFGQAQKFYQDVNLNWSWEKDFLPLESNPSLSPIKLIMVLDLYFRLIPITMVPETWEITELSKLIKVSPEQICEIMTVFQFCDPYLNHDDMMINPLLAPCQEIWQRYGNDNPEKLSSLAAQLKEYFK